MANYHVQMFVDFDGGFTADEYEKRVTLVALSVQSVTRADGHQRKVLAQFLLDLTNALRFRQVQYCANRGRRPRTWLSVTFSCNTSTPCTHR